MLPNQIMVIDSMPLTANGKVDSAALAASEEVWSAQAASHPYVAPATRFEIWLADAWGHVLQYDDVSVEDEFFACGGKLPARRPARQHHQPRVRH